MTLNSTREKSTSVSTFVDLREIVRKGINPSKVTFYSTMAKETLTPKNIANLLGNDKINFQDYLIEYFGEFETREYSKKAYMRRGQRPKGNTGRFFEDYSALCKTDSLDGNNVSAAICLSITGRGFWVSSLMNENFDLKPLETPKYADITETPDDYFDDSSPFKDLYEKMQKINYVGPVTATKLLASNAPHLFPVRDGDVAGLFESSKKLEPFTYLEWCTKVREIMKDENVNDLLNDFLEDLKSKVEMQNPPSLLRVFDVIFWSKAQKNHLVARKIG